MKAKPINPQIKQIAQQLGLSQSTISIVLNGRGDELRIAKKTQEKILTLAKDMHYQSNIYARRLRNTSERQPNQIISIFWNDSFVENTMSRFFRGVFDAIEKNQYGVEIMIRLFKSGKLEEHREFMTTQKYNGIIIAGATAQDVDFLHRESFEVPIVLSSRLSEHFSCVYTDGYVIGQECGRLFAQKGFKTASVLGVERGTSSSSLRELGFLNACDEMGIEVRDEWVLHGKSLNMEDGYLIASNLLRLKEKPEALFIIFDSMAMGALFAFKEAHINIPQELSIIVYGLNPMLRRTSPSICMVGNAMESVGESSVDLLMTIMNNKIPMPISRMISPMYEFGESFSPEEGALKTDDSIAIT